MEGTIGRTRTILGQAEADVKCENAGKQIDSTGENVGCVEWGRIGPMAVNRGRKNVQREERLYMSSRDTSVALRSTNADVSSRLTCTSSN